MSVMKDERLQVRVDPSEKRLIERAAEAAHVSVSAFVLQSAAERATAVLAERHLIELDAASATAFDQALNQPAQVNGRLAAAMARPRQFSWID